MNAIVKTEQHAIQSASDVRAHVNRIQEVMKAVMKRDVHYGVIPGTQKPTLYKPGAEVLATTFRLAPSYITEDLSTDTVSRYRVTCRLTHQTTGVVMGDGMGACSSDEEKYKWRRPVCDEEFNGTPENVRRVKFAKGKGTQVFKNPQIRTEKADIDNTILKMACKRAFIAATLNVLAASDIFTQDIEDLPEELREVDNEQEPEQKKKPEKGSYTDEKFNELLPAWKDLVESGKKTAKDILAMVESKVVLTNEQHNKIFNLGVQNENS